MLILGQDNMKSQMIIKNKYNWITFPIDKPDNDKTLL